MMISPDPQDWLLAGAVALGWAGLSWRALRPVHRRAAPGGLLIGYASQSGTAADLAARQAAALAPLSPRLLPLDRITPQDLAGAGQALFVIATTGQGAAPDHARAFLPRLAEAAPDLRHLSYALLALGDRGYADFCAYGRAVDAALQIRGARALCPRVDLDRDAPEALAAWQGAVAACLGAGADPVALSPRWRLAARHQLNPGSPGGALWALRFLPEGALPDWRAGDIATVEIPRAGQAPLRRDYSVASIPGSGGVDLLVRQVIDAEGRAGQGSHHLTQTLAIGDGIGLRLRANPAFRAKDDHAPMILIGNGSGLAGLLAHLRHRAAQPDAGPVWLIFGERCPIHDRLFAAELHALQAAGGLTRLDRVFSRGARPAYVQDLLRDQAQTLRDWLDLGAVIHLCGRRTGMAGGVIAALQDALGPAGLETLRQTGRLRQDVY